MHNPTTLGALASALLFVLGPTTGCSSGPQSAPLASPSVDAGPSSSDDAGADPSKKSGDASAENPGTTTGDDAGSDPATDGGTCFVPPPPQDPSSFPSCCSAGAAHCLPDAEVPPNDKSQLAMCSGGYCVPDTFISNPAYQPPMCTAFNGAQGACLSVCVPQVAQYQSILTQATCATDERCTPCINPITNQSSGACSFAQATVPCGADGGPSTNADGGP
jgi:hypothetical protein